MTTPRLVIFDDRRGRFGPMTDLRPVFDLRSGALTTRQRLERALRQTATVGELPSADDLLLVNGRYLGATATDRVNALTHEQALVQADGQVIAARLTTPTARQFADNQFSTPPAPVQRVPLDQTLLIERPWHLLAQLDATLRADLASFDLPKLQRDTPLVPTLGENDIRVAPSAKLHPMVLINCEKGPVVIDEGAIVGSFAVVAGPCYLGPHTIVAPHAHIRSHTVIGAHCVVGGEVSYSIVDDFGNKAHAGYLGHALLGQWVNLGAETTASNLKNTYGSVRMQLESDTDAEDTGMNKLGPVIGDFVRTAIATRINTGACLGTASMIALSGFTPKFIDRFTFATDAGLERYDVDKFLATARAMMARRKQTLSPALETHLRQLATIY